MSDQSTSGIGMRYLGGWGGDIEHEVQSSTAPAQAQVLDMIFKRLRQRTIKEKEYIFKRCKQKYDTITSTLFDETEREQLLANDTYLKKVRRDLELT